MHSGYIAWWSRQTGCRDLLTNDKAVMSPVLCDDASILNNWLAAQQGG